MSKKKTDLEVFQGLRKWIIDLNLPNQKHVAFSKGEEVDGYSSDMPFIQVYHDGPDYVYIEDHAEGRRTKLTIRNDSVSFNDIDLNNLDQDLSVAAKRMAEFDVRKFNVSVRNRLRFLITDVQKRAEEQKRERILELKEELSVLEAK